MHMSYHPSQQNSSELHFDQFLIIYKNHYPHCIYWKEFWEHIIQKVSSESDMAGEMCNQAHASVALFDKMSKNHIMHYSYVTTYDLSFHLYKDPIYSSCIFRIFSLLCLHKVKYCQGLMDGTAFVLPYIKIMTESRHWS